MKSLFMGYRFWRMSRWIQKQKKRRVQGVSMSGQILDATALFQTVDALAMGQAEIACSMDELTLRLDVMIQKIEEIHDSIRKQQASL